MLADLIGHSAVLHFLHHASGHHRLLLIAWHPNLLARDRAGAMNLLIASATRTEDLSATIAVPLPATGCLHTTVTARSRALLNDCFPLAAAAIDLLAFDDWLADRVAHIAVMRLAASLVSRVALVAIAGLINRLANSVALVAVAGLIDRLADRVALVAIARLSVRHLNGVLLTAPSGLLDRLADGVANVLVAGLINRLASFVSLVAEVSLADVASALHRHLFADRIIGRAIFRDRAFVVHNVLHHLVLSGAARSCRAKISTGRACGGWAARIASCSAIAAGER